eukprot:183286-Chlamydomonas_euryale.AAC.1
MGLHGTWGCQPRRATWDCMAHGGASRDQPLGIAWRMGVPAEMTRMGLHGAWGCQPRPAAWDCMAHGGASRDEPHG